MRDHAPELDYDLMTMTGRTLDEYADMGAAGYVALCHFVRCIPCDSALYRATHEGDGMPEWATTAKTNAILADIYDAYANVHSKKKNPKPYPRPGDRRAARGIGGGSAATVSEIDGWTG